MAVKDFTKIFLAHPGLWVALRQDEKTVLASSRSAKKAYNEALSKGEKRPVLLKVPSQSTYYVGGEIQ